jgi:hypothetical protein
MKIVVEITGWKKDGKDQFEIPSLNWAAGRAPSGLIQNKVTTVEQRKPGAIQYAGETVSFMMPLCEAANTAVENLFKNDELKGSILCKEDDETEKLVWGVDFSGSYGAYLVSVGMDSASGAPEGYMNVTLQLVCPEIKIDSGKQMPYELQS